MGNRIGINSSLQRDSPCVWIYLKTRRRSLQRSFLFPNFSLGRIRFFLCHGVLPAGPAPAESNNKNKKKESFLSSTCGFGMIQRYEGLWGPVKVQRSIVSPIISRAWIRIQDFYPGSKIIVLNILDPYNVRLEIFKFEPFSDLRFSSHRNWSKTKKQSMNFRQKHYLKSFVFCFCGFIEDLLQPTSFKSSSSRFSKILHNFKFGWTPSR